MRLVVPIVVPIVTARAKSDTTGGKDTLMWPLVKSLAIRRAALQCHGTVGNLG
jgi:hypothetical protein